jgi:hypothetical protein
VDVIPSLVGKTVTGGRLNALKTLQLLDDYIVTGADAGGTPLVYVSLARTGAVETQFYAYDAGFTGGVRVAAADVTGDGVPDIVTAPGAGGVPLVKVFDGRTFGLVLQFYAYDPAFTGGVYVAAADVTGDARADIITGTGAGGVPLVNVYNGVNAALLLTFFAYDPTVTVGVRVAAADFTGDNLADIVTAPGAGVAPHVRVFNGTTGLQVLGPIGSFFAYDPTFLGGVFVAAGDFNGDGIKDVVTGAGQGGAPHVKVFSGNTGGILTQFFAYDTSYTGGVRVGLVDMDGDGAEELLTAPGTGPLAQVRVWSATRGLLNGFYPYDGASVGVFVSGKRRRR